LAFRGYQLPRNPLYYSKDWKELSLGLEEKYAFVEEVAVRHGDNLRRFLRSRVRNASDIPDIVQEVFLRLLRVPNHETIRAPEAYIFTIANHVAQQHALQLSSTAGSVELTTVLSELRAATESDPALEVSAQQCLEELNRALKELGPKVQATFLFHRRDGMSIEEIAKNLGISQPMAKKYMVRALVHFRKRLRETE
jgi:RNA polymerase sigma factor (sigma-70 family)